MTQTARFRDALAVLLLIAAASAAPAADNPFDSEDLSGTQPAHVAVAHVAVAHASVGHVAADHFAAGPVLTLERGGALPGGEATGGVYQMVLVASTAGEEPQGGDFEIRPGGDPGGESGASFLFADGFESGTIDGWSAAIGASP